MGQEHSSDLSKPDQSSGAAVYHLPASIKKAVLLHRMLCLPIHPLASRLTSTLTWAVQVSAILQGLFRRNIKAVCDLAFSSGTQYMSFEECVFK